MSRRLPFLLPFVGWLFLFSCAPPEEAPQEIVVGVITTYSRNIATLEGARLAADEINAAGGVDVGTGRARLSVLFEDDETRPETAVSKALLLINRKGAVALVGLPMSMNAIPVARVAEQSGVPMISTLSTHPETTLGKQYAFRMTFLNSFQAREMARFAVEELGIRKAAILTNAASEYSTHLAEAFRECFPRLGGEVVAFQTFIDDESFDDVDAQLLEIRESGAEALFMPYHSKAARRHMLKARDLGVEAVFLGSDTWNTIALGDEPLVGNSYFIDVWAPDLPSERATVFAERYRRTFGSEPTTSAALAYDAVMMLAEAIRQQQKADPASIRTGLASLATFEGVTGAITFEGSGDPKRSAVIRKIHDDGSLRFYRQILSGASPGAPREEGHETSSFNPD